MVKVIDILRDSVSLTWVPVRGEKPDRGPGQRESFDFVILAIPPSVWDQPDNVSINVEVRGKPVPVHLKDNPGTMGMQPAVKFFSDVKERFWIKDKAAPYGGALNLGQVWEGTDNQTQVRQIPDPQGQLRKVEQGIVLSVFAGPILAGGRAPTEKEFKQRLENLYPGGYTRDNLNRTLFSDWPNADKEPFIKTGYASPEKNQIFTIGRKLNAPFHDRLFFAGEHTDMAFFGYMEGALRSGERAANRLMLKKCRLPAQPATQPPSQTFVARAAPTREYGPLQQQIGIASEGAWGASKGGEDWQRTS
jgi:monoamine oxidase